MRATRGALRGVCFGEGPPRDKRDFQNGEIISANDLQVRRGRFAGLKSRPALDSEQGLFIVDAARRKV
ncbi:MAG: hypothetical protein DMG40_15340 [Acidobacteria bacterium]|nr:MAG: hypothetical protein DMG40_15340 [Acidobacteriota bacterium]